MHCDSIDSIEGVLEDFAVPGIDRKDVFFYQVQMCMHKDSCIQNKTTKTNSKDAKKWAALCGIEATTFTIPAECPTIVHMYKK